MADLTGVLDRLRLRRAPTRPRQIHLSVTDRCFLPCLHCDIWRNKATDLPEAAWAQVIDRLGDWCAPAGMNFVGGEPLLRPDLERLMARAVGHGFQVSFNTNGWLVDAERARSIAQAGVSVAYVSLDGVRPETVDRTRGRAGSYAHAMGAIEHLGAQPRLRVVVASILHADNAEELVQLAALAGGWGIELVVQPLYQNFGDHPYDPDWWRTHPLFPRDKERLRAIEDALDALTAERLRGGPIQNAAAQLQAMKEHFREPGAVNGLTCRAGHTDLSFDPQGNVRLCYFLEPIGTIFEATPFPVMWDRPRALRRRWQVSRCDRHCNLLNCNFEG